MSEKRARLRWTFLADHRYQALNLQIIEFKNASAIVHLLTAISKEAFYLRDVTVDRRSFPESFRSVSIFSPDPDSNFDNKFFITPRPHEIIDRFLKLPLETKVKVKSAIHLLYNGIIISEEMHEYSLSFVALVSSLETLVSIEYPDAPMKCQECKQPRFQVAKKFISFLKKFAGNTPAEQKKYKAIYAKRSDIAHSGRLLMGPLEMFMDSTDDEFIMLHGNLIDIAKKAFINWLLKRELS